jgi:hypothetical protein
MIERFLVKGARFKWAAPPAISADKRDGAIIANPPTPPGTMTYVGMDGEIIDFGLPNVTAMGFTMNMVLTYSWLNYVLGRTAKIATTNDVLTGFMSGCLIATWSDTGGRWVGHIGTVESAGKYDPPNSDVKLEFQTNMPENVRGYNPAAAWSPEEIAPIVTTVKGKPAAKIVSLVTATSDFYSVLMVSRMDEPGIWVCAGKKLVAGMGHQGLFNELAVPMKRMDTFVK